MFRGGEAEPKPHPGRCVKRTFWCVVWAHGGGCSVVGKMEQIRVRVEVEQIPALRGLHERIRHVLLKVTASESTSK